MKGLKNTSVKRLVEVEKKSILVVDDDKIILESLKTILQSEGYSVDIAETGKEAIEKSKARFHHLALLNIKLPDVKGTKLLTAMHENFPKMVKIMLTGLQPEKAGKFLNLDVDTYIMKPVNPEELLKVIREKLREEEEAEGVSK